MAKVAVPLAVIASGAMIYQASNAAFTATTSTGSNSWTAGSVVLTDSTSGSALFTVSALKPGFAAAASKCVKVSYAGNLNANIRMYVSAYTSTARAAAVGPPVITAGTELLGDYLRVGIQDGTGNAADCSDFTPNAYLTSGGAPSTTGGESFKAFWTSYNAFPTLPATYDGPATTWAVTGAATKTFKITYWLPDLGETGAPTTFGAPFTSLQQKYDDIQGSSLSATLTWQAQSS
jgi:hypothetical protein